MSGRAEQQGKQLGEQELRWNGDVRRTATNWHLRTQPNLLAG
jgi:hypothetical protein